MHLVALQESQSEVAVPCKGNWGGGRGLLEVQRLITRNILAATKTRIQRQGLAVNFCHVRRSWRLVISKGLVKQSSSPSTVSTRTCLYSLRKQSL